MPWCFGVGGEEKCLEFMKMPEEEPELELLEPEIVEPQVFEGISPVEDIKLIAEDNIELNVAAIAPKVVVG